MDSVERAGEAMAKGRKAISKTTRFEVFKRDKFTCQYCGKAAPDVVLHVDHIQPVAKAGENDVLNLITSCADCNLGKGARALSDDTAVQKRKQQLDDLQERREQLDMMVEWQRSLMDLDGQAAENACNFWQDIVVPYGLTDYGKSAMAKLVRRWGIGEVCECIRISTDQYLEKDGDSWTHESVNKAFDYIGRIANNRKRIKDRPYLEDLYHIRSIARRHCNYFNEWQSLELLETAYHALADVDDLRLIALGCHNWTGWRGDMEDLIKSLTGK